MTRDPLATAARELLEVWRPIAGFEGYYEVSSIGRVRSCDRVVQVGTYLRPLSSIVLKQLVRIRRGRPWRATVVLRKHGGSSIHSVHHLVLSAFVCDRPAGAECRHLNGDPTDNRVENLCWGTTKENAQDRVRHGTQTRGATVPNAKLTDEAVREIRRLYASGVPGSELAARFGCDKTTIHDTLRGERWRHVQ